MNPRGLSPAAQLLLLSAGTAAAGYTANKMLRKKRDVAMSPLQAALLAAAVPVAYQFGTGTGVGGNFRRWGAGGLLTKDWYDIPYSDRVNRQSYQDSFMNRATITGSQENDVYNKMQNPAVDLAHNYLPRTSTGNLFNSLLDYARGSK